MKKCSILILSLSAVFGMGCSKDSASDVAKRDRDREREKAESIFSEFQGSQGSYWGASKSGDFNLNIKTAWAQNDNSASPQASIVGALVFYPLLTVKSSEPVQVPFNVTAGSYSEISKTLTMNINDGDKDSKMVCAVNENEHLTCSWYTTRGALELVMVKDDSISSHQMVPRIGEYQGENASFNISAEFKNLFVKSSAGKQVQSQISAVFRFSEKGDISAKPHVVSMHSNDGSYDYLKNSVTFNIDGDTPIVVNCRILTQTDLHCLWSSAHDYEFDLKLSTDVGSSVVL